MATATRETQGGNIIEVEVRRDVRDTMWEGLVTGREVSEYTTITLKRAGKVIVQGREVGKLRPSISKRDAEMAEKGAVARLGDAYLTAEAADLISEAMAEAEAAEPGSEEYWALKNAAAERKAAAERRQEEDAAWREEYEAFSRRMDDPHSDL